MDGGGFVAEEETEYHGVGGFVGRACCEGCGSLTFRQDYYQAFQVMVCPSCARLEEYKLVPKGTAKGTYMLTDSDLKKLGHLTKSNPQRKQWADMKLYLQKQVIDVAIRRHGSSAAIQEVKQQRLEARLATRLDKTKHVEDVTDQDSTAKPQTSKAHQQVLERLTSEYGDQRTSGASGQWVAAPTTQDRRRRNVSASPAPAIDTKPTSEINADRPCKRRNVITATERQMVVKTEDVCGCPADVEEI